MAERTNSMCAVYADLIETQLTSEETDMDTVMDLLSYIRQYCHTVGHEPGEVPEHLEEHQFEPGRGEGETGTVMVDGKEMPRSALDGSLPGE
jgi:hypothetical protein